MLEGWVLATLQRETVCELAVNERRAWLADDGGAPKSWPFDTCPPRAVEVPLVSPNTPPANRVLRSIWRRPSRACGFWFPAMMPVALGSVRAKQRMS